MSVSGLFVLVVGLTMLVGSTLLRAVVAPPPTAHLTEAVKRAPATKTDALVKFN